MDCLGVTARGMAERVVGGVEGGHFERYGEGTGVDTREYDMRRVLRDEASQRKDAEQSTVHHWCCLTS